MTTWRRFLEMLKPRPNERAAIDAEFELLAADTAYRAESADLMREFEVADREAWENLAKAER